MGKIAIGCLVAICIGSACRWYDVPLPSPTRLQGALLVVAMTLGYFGTDMFMAKVRPAKGPATTAPLCGGPSGLTSGQKTQEAQPQ